MAAPTSLSNSTYHSIHLSLHPSLSLSLHTRYSSRPSPGRTSPSASSRLPPVRWRYGGTPRWEREREAHHTGKKKGRTSPLPTIMSIPSQSQSRFFPTLHTLPQLITPFHLYFNPRLIASPGWEAWRIVTPFLYYGPLGLDWLFHMFFLVKYASALETGSFRGRSADFAWMLGLCGAALLCAAPLAKAQFLGAPLAFALVYVWARRHPAVLMSFLGVLTFTAPWLPWVLLGVSVLLRGSATVDLLGMAVGESGRARWDGETDRPNVDLTPPLSLFPRPLLLLPGGRLPPHVQWGAPPARPAPAAGGIWGGRRRRWRCSSSGGRGAARRAARRDRWGGGGERGGGRRGMSRGEARAASLLHLRSL